MKDTNTERQRAFKDKMYKAGFKQMIVWVKRKEEKEPAKMNRSEFALKLKKLTSDWDEENLSQLFNLLVKITKAKKEAIKLKRKT